MGQEFCNACIRQCKNEEENNFSSEQNNLLYFNDDYKNDNNIIHKDTKENKSNSLLKYYLPLRKSNNFFNETIAGRNTNYQEEFESKEEIKFKIINEELNKIIYNYKLNLIYNFFIKLKKAKEESHKIIFVEKIFEDKTSLNNDNNNDFSNQDINLYPIKEYEYIGNKFKFFKDGFGIQKFYNKDKNINASYIGYFRNNYRIGYCKYFDYNKKYIYNGDICFNNT